MGGNSVVHSIKSWLYKVQSIFKKGFIEKSLPQNTDDTINKIICYRMAFKNLTVYMQLSVYVMPSTAIILSVEHNLSKFP